MRTPTRRALFLGAPAAAVPVLLDTDLAGWPAEAAQLRHQPLHARPQRALRRRQSQRDGRELGPDASPPTSNTSPSTPERGAGRAGAEPTDVRVRSQAVSAVGEEGPLGAVGGAGDRSEEHTS